MPKLLLSNQVKSLKTPWAKAWDHHAICVNMDGILRSCGITEVHVRRRMTINAIIAAGWRQNCWHYNAWGVKVGGWQGAWYAKTTQEDDGSGNYYTIVDDAWRAFDSWSQAVLDYLGRINTDSSRYAESAQKLWDPAVTDGEWWKQMGADGYYTDTTQNPVALANSIGKRIKKELASATAAEVDTSLKIEVGGHMDWNLHDDKTAADLGLIDDELFGEPDNELHGDWRLQVGIAASVIVLLLIGLVVMK